MTTLTPEAREAWRALLRALPCDGPDFAIRLVTESRRSRIRRTARARKARRGWR